MRADRSVYQGAHLAKKTLLTWHRILSGRKRKLTDGGIHSGGVESIL